MSDNTPLKVVLMWHMHQPEYRDLRIDEYQLPWTYLHGIKDYVDMAAHIERNTNARAVFNFAPVLLDQIQDYTKQISDYLNLGTPIRDKLLSALAEPVLPVDEQSCRKLILDCLRANQTHIIDRFKPYKKLSDIANIISDKPEMLTYMADQYIFDLLVWYHLGWMGETVRHGNETVKQLMQKEKSYTLHDRRRLLGVIGELMGSIIPRYKALALQGKIELAMSPYAHPIIPLLLDIKSTHEAMPDANLPILENYPGGEQRAQWHLEKGIKTFQHHFGITPVGCWPSEGSLSNETLRLLDESGFSWTASGGTVLHNSINASEPEDIPCIHQSYHINDNPVNCYFRDDGLSDLIGFNYSNWHADDAVANLVHHLENISKACADNPDSIVSIILDGENAWEYYPENGYYFLDALYEQLGNHPDIELTTYKQHLSTQPQTTTLDTLVAGSWVYGTFSTWIGDNDKNRAWDMLGDAKHAFDKAMQAGTLKGDRLKKAEHQLAICEGSDWFWWFGDYNPANTVSDFEHLFRLNLSILYRIINQNPPDYLSQTFTHGSGTPAMGGVMRPGQENT
ncbi:MAG: glycoside hydrolase [Gammaproteobacteria bacterium]|nr:glycoside hydrolase [Gammaproteobacteria bacterium]